MTQKRRNRVSQMFEQKYKPSGYDRQIKEAGLYYLAELGDMVEEQNKLLRRLCGLKERGEK